MKVNEVTIVGAGPAGISAAVQLKRFGISAIVFEQHQIGGLVRNANKIENYPGFPTGITGMEFAKLLAEHVKQNSLDIRFEKVISLTFENDLFITQTTNKSYKSKFAIVASGTKPRLFNDFAIPDELIHKIFYEVAELNELRNKQIAIIGAGDAAFDYALNLARANTVTIINRSSQIKALEILQKRLAENPNITYKENLKPRKFFSHKNGIVILCTDSNNNEHRIYADILIFAIGRKPNIDFVSSSAQTADGIFFCGDVTNDRFRQIAIAIGDGIKVAMKIHCKLRQK